MYCEKGCCSSDSCFTFLKILVQAFFNLSLLHLQLYSSFLKCLFRFYVLTRYHECQIGRQLLLAMSLVCNILTTNNDSSVPWSQASGNVTIETVHKIGQTGVTYISRLISSTLLLVFWCECYSTYLVYTFLVIFYTSSLHLILRYEKWYLLSVRE